MKLKPVLLVIYSFVSLAFMYYLFLPLSSFPEIQAPSIQSFEPADVETSLRRAYYTDINREEAVLYTKSHLNLNLFGLDIPGVRLNYPPEEAGRIIRDQTKSSYLEELAMPMRESFFVNGFIAKEEKDAMIVDDKRWYQKVTIRHVTSPLFARLAIGFLTVMLTPIVLSNFVASFARKDEK